MDDSKWMGKICLVLLLVVVNRLMAAWESGFVWANFNDCDWLDSGVENLINAQSDNYLLTVSLPEQGEVHVHTTLLEQVPLGICRCGELLLVANGTGGIHVIRSISGAEPVVVGSFLDGFVHTRLVAIDSSSFISVNDRGAVRRYRLAAGQPRFIQQLPDCYEAAEDLDVTEDTLRVLTTERLTTIPLNNPAAARELDLHYPWQQLHYHRGTAALLDNEQAALINAQNGMTLLQTTCRLATFLGDTLWLFTPEGQLRYALHSSDSWSLHETGFNFGAARPQQMTAVDNYLLVTTDAGEFWWITTTADPQAVLLWQGSSLIRQVELVDHRLLLSGLTTRYLLQLHDENSTAQLALPTRGLYHLTPTGSMSIASDSLRWNCPHQSDIEGGGFSLSDDVCDGLSYEDGFLLLWCDRLCFYTATGTVLEELSLNYQHPPEFQRQGETVLVVGGERVQLIRRNSMGNLAISAEWHLEELRVAVYSMGMVFLLNPAGIWVAAADEEPRLTVPLQSARTLAGQGCRLAVGLEEGTVQMYRYSPANDSFQAEEQLSGSGRVEQIVFRETELAVLRSSGLVIYRQEPLQSEWDDSSAPRVMIKEAANQQQLRIEMSLLNPFVRAGEEVRLELGNRSPSAVSLYNILGQRLRTYRLDSYSGSVGLSLPSLSAGSYFLHSVTEGESRVVRFYLIR